MKKLFLLLTLLLTSPIFCMEDNNEPLTDSDQESDLEVDDRNDDAQEEEQAEVNQSRITLAERMFVDRFVEAFLNGNDQAFFQLFPVVSDINSRYNYSIIDFRTLRLAQLYRLSFLQNYAAGQNN